LDQISAMRVFIRVVESGNFTRAAISLNIPKTTVTNLVQSLEGKLRTKLLNRTTRRVVVTTDGALYYERALQILTELDELDNSLSNSQAQAFGRLRVEMSGAFSDLVVIPALVDFYKRYPQVQLDIGVGDRLVDYMAENVDCALRVGTPTDQTLVARRVGEIRLMAYAAPKYLAKFGHPAHPSDLETNHFSVGYLNAQSGRVMNMAYRRGDEVHEIEPRYIVSLNDSRSYLSAAVAGMGIAQTAPFMAREALDSGLLEPVLTDWQCDALPIYVVYPRTRHLSNKVRVFVDWISRLMQDIDRRPPVVDCFTDVEEARSA